MAERAPESFSDDAKQANEGANSRAEDTSPSNSRSRQPDYDMATVEKVYLKLDRRIIPGMFPIRFIV